ncbi:MAG TPA: multicopper oxidase domain-containing protein [Solirubrobacteraceae bacterium]|nr:multicopper oxidase domain-containing protein [Solirubrobacteraceae bacterium]
MDAHSGHAATRGVSLTTDQFFHEPEAPLAFSDMPHHGSPATPNKVRPDVVFQREFFSDKIEMSDGRRVDFWSFKDKDGRKTFPAPTIRLRQGQVAHTIVKPSKHAHTIHHHGIEPGPHDDGVGHTSFEVTGEYTYQWRPAQAGTYFYHCHVNTVVHFEMGMWGGLIVDPPEGPGHLFPGTYRYDVEAFWPSSGWDPSKHELNHAAGLDGKNERLNLYRPKYFHINGAFGASARRSSRSSVRAKVGQTILVRTLNAGYAPARVSFGGLTGLFVGSDGRRIPRPFSAQEWTMGGAERYDVLLTPTTPGTYRGRFEHFDYLTNVRIGVVEADIVVI